MADHVNPDYGQNIRCFMWKVKCKGRIYKKKTIMLLYRNHIESKGHCIEPYRIMKFVHCYTPTIYLFIVINFPMSFLFSCMCTLYILSLSLFNSITLSIYLSFFYLSIYISIYVNLFISLYTIYYWSASLCLTLSICDVLWKNW